MVKAWINKDREYRKLFFRDEDRRRLLKIFNSLNDRRRWWIKLEFKKSSITKFHKMRRISIPSPPIKTKDWRESSKRVLCTNTSRTSISNRCIETGRGRGILKDFGISRLYFKRLYKKNQLVGISKASW